MLILIAKVAGLGAAVAAGTVERDPAAPPSRSGAWATSVRGQVINEQSLIVDFEPEQAIDVRCRSCCRRPRSAFVRSLWSIRSPAEVAGDERADDPYARAHP